MKQKSNPPISKVLKNSEDISDAESEKDNSRPKRSAIANRPQKFLSDYADFDPALNALGKTAQTDLIINKLVSIKKNKGNFKVSERLIINSEQV